jgi:hypothetical protein
VVLLSSPAMAANKYWNGGALGSWNVASNWLTIGTDGVPTGATGQPAAGDDVYWSLVRSDFDDAGWSAYKNYVADNSKSKEMTVANPSWLGWTNQTILTYSGDPALPTLNTLQFGSAIISNAGKMVMGTLNLRQDLSVNTNLTLGGDDYCAGELNIYDGADVYVKGEFRVTARYRGVVNMYGGTVFANKRLLVPRSNSGWAGDGGTGLSELIFDDNNDGVMEDHSCTDGHDPCEFTKCELNMYAGTITLNNSSGMDFSKSYPAGKITMGKKAVLKWKGNHTLDVNSWITGSRLVAFPGETTPSCSYDGTWTIVIPEPATMLLLGLGGFGLIRRRK